MCVCVPWSFIGVILMSKGEELFMEHEQFSGGYTTEENIFSSLINY